MPYTLSEIIVLFFTYSVVGWLWETVYCSLKDHHYDYRGFLFGPYCPVYGFAVTTILICTNRVQNNLWLLFIVGFIVATVFEYFASVFLEYVFHMKLWDYSHLWGNLQGRVAPMISLFWGIGVVLLVKFIHPFIQKIINWEEAQTHGWLAVMITVGMGTDFILTMISVQHFHTTTKMWNQRINQRLQLAHIDLEHWREDAVAHLEEIRPERRLTWNERRLLKSFPHLIFNDAERFNKIKHEILRHQLRHQSH